jgi:hypothetical protein
MLPPDVLEVAAVFGSIVGIWFALVGWKLVPANSNAHARHPDRRLM